VLKTLKDFRYAPDSGGKADAAESQNRAPMRAVTAEQKRQILQLAQNFPRLWSASTTSKRDRKRILRLLVRVITVVKGPASKMIKLHVRWHWETRRPILLFETGLPTRYYIPKLDVRMNLLESTDSVTRCPYRPGAVGMRRGS
jgi:hypothetical protein